MRKFIIIVSLSLFLLGFSRHESTPIFSEVDLRVKWIVDEYKKISAEKKLVFRHEVPVGFTHINMDDIVGRCTGNSYFKEIILDIDYWNNISVTRRLALLYHELTHCYCGRGHDYKDGMQYSLSALDILSAQIRSKMSGEPMPGFWKDGCPTSLMYPSVVEEQCMKEHYSEYTSEMFDRCDSF